MATGYWFKFKVHIADGSQTFNTTAVDNEILTDGKPHFMLWGNGSNTNDSDPTNGEENGHSADINDDGLAEADADHPIKISFTGEIWTPE